jgi:hypothetical protein
MMRFARILLACGALVSVQAAETPAERGKRLVNEALQALGGDAFSHMTDRLEIGRAYSFYHSEITGLQLARIYTRYSSAPAPGKLGLRERESFLSGSPGKPETSAVLFTEDGAWEITFRGAEPLDPQRYQNFKDTTARNIFYILRCRLSEPGLDFYWKSTDVFENRPVEIVDITDAANQTVTVTFDQDSKLPMRQTFRHRNPQFKDFDTEVTLFANYRASGHGVQWPTNVRRERNGDKIFEMYSDSVEVGKNLADDLFTLPAKIKILPPPK